MNDKKKIIPPRRKFMVKKICIQMKIMKNFEKMKVQSDFHIKMKSE
jgi:hypothetical protein